MLIPVLCLSLLATTVVIILAAQEQKQHHWRRCLKCGLWFGEQGEVAEELPLLGRFCIHGDGVCPECAATNGRGFPTS